jgi:hypothetical protein
LKIENAVIVFHFNKKHIEDQTIPPWVLKVKGESYYVWHLTVEPGVGFTTKETPDNPHTKGALKFKGNLSFIENDGRLEGVIS